MWPHAVQTQGGTPDHFSLTLGDDECVCNVGGVVDAEADAEDDVDAGDGVDGEAPEVDHARDVDQGEEDAGQDLHAESA